MKIALEWIEQYLTGKVNPAAAEEALINAGLPLESNEALGDTHVLDVEVTSNRTDCLSHVGLARELSALLGIGFKMPQPEAKATGKNVQELTSVTVDDPVACPYYSARLLTGVKVGPSPAWMVKRLEAIGLRSVNNVVDVTNYVLMELGQPLHTFDLDKLVGPKIVVRRANPGEKIVAIDGRNYELTPAMLVIADAARPVAVAGVMGGKDSEVTDQTTNILLESARFDPVTIRTQARALTLMSDSSYRFERGIDPAAAERASLRAAQLIMELAGGTLAQGLIAVGNADAAPKKVTMRCSRLKQILGYDVPAEKVTAILAALGFDPKTDAGLIHCTVPSHRLDVEREIDLIEEVARVYGYKHIPLGSQVTHGVQPEPAEEKAGRVIRQALHAAGFNETISVTFVDESEAQTFLPKNDAVRPIRVSDAVRKASNVLRPSLLPSLLAVRRTNQNAGITDARIYEHSEAFWQEADAKTKEPTQYRFLSLVGNNVAEVRGTLEIVLERLNAHAWLNVTPTDYRWFAPGVGAKLELCVGQRCYDLGCLGEFSDDVRKQYDLRYPTAGAEVYWDALVEAFEPVRRGKALPRFPGVIRDLSVVVADDVRWSAVEAAIKEAKLAFAETVNFVGTFRNKQIGEGKKSLTLSIEFRDPNATLRSEQVDEQIKSAVEVLQQKVGAVMR